MSRFLGGKSMTVVFTPLGGEQAVLPVRSCIPIECRLADGSLFRVVFLDLVYDRDRFDSGFAMEPGALGLLMVVHPDSPETLLDIPLGIVQWRSKIMEIYGSITYQVLFSGLLDVVPETVRVLGSEDGG
jgi:hypothetical protein